jgi:hypothetical protein
MTKIKQKLTAFLKRPLVLFLTISIAAIVFLIVIIRLLSGGGNSGKTAEQMQNEKPAQASRDVRYTTQETLSTLTGETDNLEKNISAIQKQFEQLKTSQDQASETAANKLKQELENLQRQNQQFKDQLSEKIKQNQLQNAKYDKLTINNANKKSGGIIWINDMVGGMDKGAASIPAAPAASGALLDDNSQNTDQEKPKPIPAYTIPANTILTGVTAEQPLIGVIPIEGTVLNPQTVQFAVGQKNLSANDWHLPAKLKGIQGSAVCEGVFNFQNSAVSCSIISLTFIFDDGNIATETAAKDEPFGKLTTLYGNPYIPGKYYGNALYGAVGTGFFSAAQGFGNAFAASQVQTQNSDNAAAITTNFKNANNYAFGQGIGTAGEALNQWWLTLMKSTTNYVYTPNWNPKTHEVLQLNAKIEKQVNIDYDPEGRKVNYEQKDNYYNSSLD